MSSVNKAILVGRVGNDPEIRTASTGTLIAKLSLATNEKRKGRSGAVTEETEWHRITFFSRLAEVVEEYVRTGDRLYVEGKIEYSQTEDEDGHTRYWVDIIGRHLVMLGSKDKRGAVETAGSAPEDDMPF